MRRTTRFWVPAGLAVLALMAWGAPAGATTFTGTISIYGTPVGGLAGDSTSTTAPNVVTVPIGATTTGMNTTFPLVTTPTPDSGAYILRISQGLGQLGAGSFSGTPLAGPMAIPGFIGATLTNLGGFPIVNLPLTMNGTRGVGLGGAVAATSYASGIWSVQGAPWTTGQAVATNVLATPLATPMTVTLTGYDNRNAAGIGAVQLVTPIQFNFAGASSGTHGVLTLNFVPEPGTMLLLGTGLAGLAFMSRRRR